MEKEVKFQILAEEYWLVVSISGSYLHVHVLNYASDRIEKFSTDVPFNNDNPLVYTFQNLAEVIEFIKSGNNYEVDIEKQVFTLKWKMIGDRFEKNIFMPIRLSSERMTEVEQLKCQNIMLKRKLSALTKIEPKEKEKEQIVKVQNKYIDRIQKNAAGNKEPIQIEISASEYCKDKNSYVENSEYDETEQNKLKREKRKPIKKREKKPFAQIKVQKQKLSNLVPQQNPPTKKRGRKKKCDQEDFKIQRVNEDINESSAISTNKVRISFSNGDYYYGQIQNNLYHGYGLYYSETNGTFEGIWVKGRANGFGISVDPTGNRHSGFYIDDKRTGKGIDEYINGEKYEGCFQEDCKSGFGKYVYQNGDFYEGFWKKDMYNGKGIQNYQDGSKYEGTWVNDQKDGQGIFTNREGKRFRQVWIRGNKENEQQIY